MAGVSTVGSLDVRNDWVDQHLYVLSRRVKLAPGHVVCERFQVSSYTVLAELQVVLPPPP